MPIQIGLAGLGVVAQGFLELLNHHYSGSDGDQSETKVQLKRIASRRMRDGLDLLGAEFSTDLNSLSSAQDLDIVVELIGGTDAAYELIKSSLNNGLGVITANKAILAEHGNELLAIANKNEVPLAFEAAVAGGIPIISVLKSAFSGNHINSVTGIINGTCNYILSQMSNIGADFQDALHQAQALGYAEADPSFDIGGTDAAQKLAILAALAFNVPINVNEIYCEGIEEITGDDIRHAEELGFAVKHLGVARQVAESVEMRVHPALVSQGNLLAKVEDVENAVQIDGRSTGTLRFMGPGAGGLATASSVMADLMNIANGLYRSVSIAGVQRDTLPLAAVESQFYLNISAADRAGVIARIGETLARHGISIDSMIQKKEDVVQTNGESVIPVIILTNQVVEGELGGALEELNGLDAVVSPIKMIRVIGT